ncbi:MAG: T9SS type A sorting domain-containing protein, partial [Bacteroidota bacterium]
PNESTELAGALTGNALFFNGDSARAANNGQPPRLYAPGAFAFGSSCTHLDQNTFRGTENGLMTPFSSSGESKQDPGPIFLGILHDLGWNRPKTISSTPPPPSRLSGLRVSPNPLLEELRIDYELERSEEVQLLIRDAHGRLLYQSPPQRQPAGANVLFWTAEGMSSGLYVYQLVAGDELRSGMVVKP